MLFYSSGVEEERLIILYEKLTCLDKCANSAKCMEELWKKRIEAMTIFNFAL
jgi:hypothetical protein